jgi:hypothetical protein
LICIVLAELGIHSRHSISSLKHYSTSTFTVAARQWNSPNLLKAFFKRILQAMYLDEEGYCFFEWSAASLSKSLFLSLLIIKMLLTYQLNYTNQFGSLLLLLNSWALWFDFSDSINSYLNWAFFDCWRIALMLDHRNHHFWARIDPKSVQILLFRQPILLSGEVLHLNPPLKELLFRAVDYISRVLLLGEIQIKCPYSPPSRRILSFC